MNFITFIPRASDHLAVKKLTIHKKYKENKGQINLFPKNTEKYTRCNDPKRLAFLEKNRSLSS